MTTKKINRHKDHTVSNNHNRKNCLHLNLHMKKKDHVEKGDKMILEELQHTFMVSVS